MFDVRFWKRLDSVVFKCVKYDTYHQVYNTVFILGGEMDMGPPKANMSLAGVPNRTQRKRLSRHFLK